MIQEQKDLVVLLEIVELIKKVNIQKADFNGYLKAQHGSAAL